MTIPTSSPRSFSIPPVAKRLGDANPNITVAIYSHALGADEIAAAKIWNDALADVIEAGPAGQSEYLIHAGSKTCDLSLAVPRISLQAR